MVSAKRMEELLGIGPIHKERIVPGTRLVEGREFCYVSNRNQEKFDMLFKKIIRYISPPIPKNGGIIIEECSITLPNGDIFEAISYKGDIEGWRLQIEQGAKALNEKVARIDKDSIVLDDMRSFHLTDCRINFH